MANYYLRTVNATAQTLAEGATVNLGIVNRRYDKRNCSGYRAFEFDGTSVTLEQTGIYDIKANITFTAGATGDVTFQMFANGTPIVGATATETIGTATTESHNVTLLGAELVNTTYILGTQTVVPETITIVATDGAPTIANVVLEITKTL